ncbi:uncharacterized protein [Macrobrachium rosenbergii]|uniref:uncharacterized protein n=1 Tax=Macrobrachium rosenbergii TaxID=79674 RepID=UPI0034D66716
MVHNLETVIVPWFSRQEWLEVYHGVLGNDVERWKEARDVMLVWQARVSKLPIGVDLTLPLLQSKIVSSDPFADNDVKSIMQGTALQRFVSNVVKLPQTKYYNHQTLHKLAAEIGLPGHLVDLRNEVIHGDSGYAGGCTVETALETAFEWIKNYYWYPEWTQMNDETEKKHQKPSSDWKCFMKSLKRYARSLLSDEYNDCNTRKSYKLTLFVEMFHHCYSVDPQGCIDAVVEILLVPLGQQCKLQSSGNGKMDKCGCIFNFHAIKGINTFLKAVLINNGSTQLMLNSLLRKLQENKEVASAWIILIVASILKGPVLKGKKGKNGICQKHFLSLQKNGVNWKRIACKLLTVEEEWSVDLATKIMNSSESNISEVQVKKIMSLLDISARKEQDRKSDRIDDISSEMSDDELFDVESVLENVHENNPETCDEYGKVQVASLLHETGAMTPLGILPHQVDNKLFYKDLLLHYPDEQDFEPPPKRQKT